MRNVTETGAVANLPQAMNRRNLRPHGVKMGLRLSVLAGVVMLFTTSVALCQNLGPYTFTLIDTSPAGYRYSVGNLSNQGEVTFTRYDPSGAQTVYLGSGGALTKIADLNSGPGFLSISGPSITRNESVNIVLSSGCPSTTTSGPSVVFSASVNPTGEGIYVGGPNQAGLTTIVQGSYGLEHGGINDNKVVAFYENVGGNGSIWKGDATQTLQIDSNGIDAQSPVINDDNFGSGILSGTVSYYSTTGSEILLDSNLTKNPLATTCGGYAVDPQTAINNNGLVAFTGSSRNATALCTEQLGGAENVILSTSAGLIAEIGDVEINIEGIVAFVLGFESFLDIYTGPSDEDIVVGVGSTLPDGNLVTGVGLGGINDYCQMSFGVTFLTPGGAEGSAVWRANPSTCPVQCPPDIICSLASTMHPPHGNVLAAMGTDPSYLMPDGLLRTGWPLPFSDDGQLRMGDMSLSLIENSYAAISGSVNSATNTTAKIAKTGDIGQASCK